MGRYGLIAMVLLLTGPVMGAAEAPVAQKPAGAPKPAPVLAPAAQPMSPMAPARFMPKTITTPPLTMTGNRFRPATITTAPLTMTGTRTPPFRPKTITTGPLIMTGERSPPTPTIPRELPPR